MDLDAKLADQFVEVNPQTLRSELDRIHNKKQSSAEASSALGHMRKTSAEQLGVHKDAMSVIERIDGMSDDKRGDFLRSYMPMFQALYPQWAENMIDMVDQMENDTKEMEEELE